MPDATPRRNAVACPDCRGVRVHRTRLSAADSGKRVRVAVCTACARETPIPPREAPGIPCPQCGDVRLKTVKTTHRVGQNVRVRKCRTCGHRVRTCERVESYAT